jgi:4-alpha-glucanotransferase
MKSLLHQLAQDAGIARLWIDADGEERQVGDESLRAILSALGLGTSDEAAITIARVALHERRSARPALITVDCDKPIALPDGDCTLRSETGEVIEIDAGRGLSRPGYYRADYEDGGILLAVSPVRCPAIERRGWGVTIQIPSLRGEQKDFGDFALLADAVTRLGACGADAVALSPVHALSLADPGRFAPYSPSSRTALNALLAPVEADGVAPSAALIDWALAGPARLEALREAFARAASDDATEGKAESFELFGQRQARAGLDTVQRAAQDAGMAIGIIADLAVGVDPQGEEARADPGAFLQGLRIGAPPDPLGPQGQDWGLIGYSPQGLADRGFAPFIAMLRANLPQGGGIRIDHAFGLQRLWVIPQGRPANEGAYISYPFADMLRLLKLEAWRADAIVIAEDLGTRPPGFGKALEEAGIYGMTVLPFTRDERGFLDATAYPEGAIAMSGTHDVATIAGWWTGRDLDWNRELERGGETPTERAAARSVLWRAIGAGAPQPGNDDPAPVIEQVLTFLAGSAAPLLLVPMEDLAGLVEQPNLPGTTVEHPNWRRRLPAPIGALLAEPAVQRRIACLTGARPGEARSREGQP